VARSWLTAMASPKPITGASHGLPYVTKNRTNVRYRQGGGDAARVEEEGPARNIEKALEGDRSDCNGARDEFVFYIAADRVESKAVSCSRAAPAHQETVLLGRPVVSKEGW
jgi:hypothetical protein